ncbi:MAG: hypothetical protein AAF959_22645 [Cyanobacteria bacterium P01_D01_bin.56]
MPEAKNFFVVRYPGNKFAPTTGKDPVAFLAEAKQFASEAEANQAASKGAVGVSEYGHGGGKPIPLKHMGLAAPVADK